jgi:hypothetical protein
VIEEGNDDLIVNILHGLPNRTSFRRAGIEKLSELARLIEERGIVFNFSNVYLHDPVKQIRNAGHKTWGVVLKALEDRGFDWQKHNLHYRTGYDPVKKNEEKKKTAPFMEYQVVREHNHKSLSDLVTEFMEEGWMPLGGVSVTARQGDYSEDTRYFYCQAMLLPVKALQQVLQQEEPVTEEALKKAAVSYKKFVRSIGLSNRTSNLMSRLLSPGSDFGDRKSLMIHENKLLDVDEWVDIVCSGKKDFILLSIRNFGKGTLSELKRVLADAQ